MENLNIEKENTQSNISSIRRPMISDSVRSSGEKLDRLEYGDSTNSNYTHSLDTEGKVHTSNINESNIIGHKPIRSSGERSDRLENGDNTNSNYTHSLDTEGKVHTSNINEYNITDNNCPSLSDNIPVEIPFTNNPQQNNFWLNIWYYFSDITRYWLNPKNLHNYRQQIRLFSESENVLYREVENFCISFVFSLILLFLIPITFSLKDHIIIVLSGLLKNTVLFKDPQLVAEVIFIISHYIALVFFIYKMKKGIIISILWILFCSIFLFLKFDGCSIDDLWSDQFLIYAGLLAIKIINIIIIDFLLCTKMDEYNRMALKKNVKLYLFLMLFIFTALFAIIRLFTANNKAQIATQKLFWNINKRLSESEIIVANIYNLVISCTLMVLFLFMIQYPSYRLTLHSDRLVECYDQVKACVVIIIRIGVALFAIKPIFDYVHGRQNEIDIMSMCMCLIVICLGYFVSFFFFNKKESKEKRINLATKKEEPYTYYSFASLVFHIVFFIITFILAFFPNILVNNSKIADLAMATA